MNFDSTISFPVAFLSTLIFISSALSFAMLSDWYSVIVAQPPDDLFARWISLFLSLMSLRTSLDLFLLPSLINSIVFLTFSSMFSLNSNCFLFFEKYLCYRKMKTLLKGRVFPLYDYSYLFAVTIYVIFSLGCL